VAGDLENAMLIDFYLKMGFEHAGTIKVIEYKFDRWLDSVLMQLPLGDGSQTIPSSKT
jgi:phosphinothricin acetyltransferase